MHPILAFLIWTVATLAAYFGISFLRALFEVLVLQRVFLIRLAWPTRIMLDTGVAAYLFHVFAAPGGAIASLVVVSVFSGAFVLVGLIKLFHRWMDEHDYTSYFRSITPKKLFSE